jgi:orotate phosphoribosyltransferase
LQPEHTGGCYRRLDHGGRSDCGVCCRGQRAESTPLSAFIVRKETKSHGTQRAIEGYDGKPGSRVIVVDDVCTTGDSILKAAEKAEQAGYQVVAAFCVVDREEGGTELIAKRYPFYPLFTAKDLLNHA